MKNNGSLTQHANGCILGSYREDFKTLHGFFSAQVMEVAGGCTGGGGGGGLLGSNLIVLHFCAWRWKKWSKWYHCR